MSHILPHVHASFPYSISIPFYLFWTTLTVSKFVVSTFGKGTKQMAFVCSYGLGIPITCSMEDDGIAKVTRKSSLDS